MSIEWGTAPDWLSAMANVAVAAAAGVAAWQGAKSLTAWRAESIGRRRLELAEEVLADFYEARDIFMIVRSPIGDSGESLDRPGRGEEQDAIRRHRDMYYPTFKRLNDKADFFSTIRVRRYRVIATFGPDAAVAYDNLNHVRARVRTAASALLRIRPEQLDQPAIANRITGYEAIIWDDFVEDDPINAELDRIIDSVEERFRPEIEASTAATTKKMTGPASWLVGRFRAAYATVTGAINDRRTKATVPPQRN